MLVSNDTMNNHSYNITNESIYLLSSLSEKLGEVNASHIYQPSRDQIKKQNLATIQASLKLDGVELSINQVAKLSNNYVVKAKEEDIQRARNFILVYSEFSSFSYLSQKDFKKAHHLLSYKEGDEKESVSSKTLKEVRSLFTYLKNSKELLLLKGMVFQYQLSALQPFSDGNRALGLYWQKLILTKYNKVFAFLPFEVFIEKRSKEFNKTLDKASEKQKPGAFVQFMLSVINDSLEDYLRKQKASFTSDERMAFFIESQGNRIFTRRDYLRRFKSIAAITASRDLRHAVEIGLLNKSGDKRMAVYRVLENDN